MGASAPFIALATTSAISSASGSFAQSSAMKAEASYQRNLFDINKSFAEMNATDAIRRGDKAANAIRKQGKQIRGAQRAAFAAQGIDVGEGSAIEIQDDTEKQAKLDAVTIKNNAYLEAWGYKAQALEYSARGAFATISGRNQSNNTLVTGGLTAVRSGLEAYAAYKK